MTTGKCWGSQIEQEMEFKCPLYIITEQIEVCMLLAVWLQLFFSWADNALAGKQNKKILLAKHKINSQDEIGEADAGIS